MKKTNSIMLALTARAQKWSKSKTLLITTLAVCGLVLFIAGHGFLIAWFSWKLSDKIGGGFPWIAGVALMAFVLYHVVRGKGHSHSRLFGGHAVDREEAERGAHDGFLVNLGHGFVEITILETDVPPRFRLFFYDKHKQTRSVPANVIAKIETVRTGGARQTFDFHAKGESLESKSDIPEPHEFKAIIQLSHGSHTHTHEVQFMRGASGRNLPPGTTGLILHSASHYDLLAWLLLLGRERVFREKLVHLARLKPGESVLDVGCGTGTLAIAAKRHVGATGTVHGIDASPEMIARADKKARKAGVEVVFKNGAAQALPFPDAHFDAVLSTLMLHHLPRKARQECACEMRRVLKPGGRVLAVDFGEPSREKRSFLSRFHRHGHVKLGDIIAVFSEAGLNSVESGAVGIRDLQFVLATASCCTRSGLLQPTDRDHERTQPPV